MSFNPEIIDKVKVGFQIIVLAYLLKLIIK